MNPLIYIIAGILGTAFLMGSHTTLKWAFWLDNKGTWFEQPRKPMQTWTALSYAALALTGPVIFSFGLVILCVAAIVSLVIVGTNHRKILPADGWWARPVLSWFKQ